MSVIALLLLAAINLLVGLFVIKRNDQKVRDANRKTYRLSFPSELDADSVNAWIRSISGTLKVGRAGFKGQPTIAFELWATSAGITHLMKVPWQHSDFIVLQLRSLVPGIRVTPEEEWPRRDWTRAVEVGLTHSSRQLRIPSTENLSASLLAAVQALEGEETIVLQWVVTPSVPTAKPVSGRATSHRMTTMSVLRGSTASSDEVDDRRHKLDEPNLLAVLRVGAVAKTDDRADHLIYRVRAALASARTSAVRFHKRMVSARSLQKRLDDCSGSLVFPMQLSSPELTALIAWPIGKPFVSGLPQALSRQLSATESVPKDGRVLGRSNFPGNERPIAVAFQEALKHVHILGPTGVGKTTLLANIVKQDMERGYGVVLIESKGDLFHDALDYVPKERQGDVIVLDVNDGKRPVGFNILNQGEPKVVVDEVVALFDQLFENRSLWSRELLYHGLHTLITDPRHTFADLAPLFSPMTPDEEEWSQHVRQSVKDRELKNFWTRFESHPKPRQEQIIQPVMDRIWQLNARPELRNIIGQSQSSFSMDEVIRDSKVLLVNLSGLAKETASLTGTLLMNSLWHSVKTQKATKPTYLVLDEFQTFLNLPIDPEQMLAQARSFGLGMTLAHQHLGQLPPELRQAVSANARTKIVFQTTSEDARSVARDFGSSVTEQDFLHLGRYEAVARVATGDGVSAPLSLTTSAPSVPHGLRRAVLDASREKYGRPISEVEDAIDKRRSVDAPAKGKRRPDIGTSKNGWS